MDFKLSIRLVVLVLLLGWTEVDSIISCALLVVILYVQLIRLLYRWLLWPLFE